MKKKQIRVEKMQVGSTTVHVMLDPSSGTFIAKVGNRLIKDRDLKELRQEVRQRVKEQAQKVERPIILSKASKALLRAVQRRGTYDEAATDVEQATGVKISRVSLWQWATGHYKPSRQKAATLFEWARITPSDWDKKEAA